jgi:hypothetical protein
LLVFFIIGYPIFIAGSFFFFLWFKPVNLYTPQTLSENLQKALLPDKLLAPDRADVAAIQLKVTQLEVLIRDVSHKMEGNSVPIVPADVAKLSDLEKLKGELLARAEAAGDVSRNGLATVAKQITETQIKSVDERARAVTSQINKFIPWLKEKGLVVSVPAPSVDAPAGDLDVGPSFGEHSVRLGPSSRDFLVPGLCINIIANNIGVPSKVEDGTFQLIWTTGEYMASQFVKVKFPAPEGWFKTTASSRPIVSEGYAKIYRLFIDLSADFGDSTLVAGIVRMINEWNSKSSLESSFRSIIGGMLEAGANAEKVSQYFKRVESQFASTKAVK